MSLTLTEAERNYLGESAVSRRLIELVEGRLIELDFPDIGHQRILMKMMGIFSSFLQRGGLGEVIQAAFPVRMGANHFRSPDLSVLLREHFDRSCNEFWDGADCVVEITSH